jgi:hypothetical protein
MRWRSIRRATRPGSACQEASRGPAARRGRRPASASSLSATTCSNEAAGADQLGMFEMAAQPKVVGAPRCDRDAHARAPRSTRSASPPSPGTWLRSRHGLNAIVATRAKSNASALGRHANWRHDLGDRLRGYLAPEHAGKSLGHFPLKLIDRAASRAGKRPRPIAAEYPVGALHER